jgi:hypothetical protein
MRMGLLLAALLPGAAWAAANEGSLGATAVILTNGGVYNDTAPRLGIDAGFTHVFTAWRLGGGVRWAPAGRGSPPLEVYVRALLGPSTGVWRPGVGPELGFSNLPIILPPTGGFPDDITRLQAEQLKPFYLAVHAQPLRFVFGSVSVSALEVQWGTPLNQPGAALRLHLGLLHVGIVR